MIMYEGHVKVEFSNKFNSIKYLFKYMDKGLDWTTMQVLLDDENCDKFKSVYK